MLRFYTKRTLTLLPNQFMRVTLEILVTASLSTWYATPGLILRRFDISISDNGMVTIDSEEVGLATRCYRYLVPSKTCSSKIQFSFRN